MMLANITVGAWQADPRNAIATPHRNTAYGKYPQGNTECGGESKLLRLSASIRKLKILNKIKLRLLQISDPIYSQRCDDRKRVKRQTYARSGGEDRWFSYWTMLSIYLLINPSRFYQILTKVFPREREIQRWTWNRLLPPLVFPEAGPGNRSTTDFQIRPP